MVLGENGIGGEWGWAKTGQGENRIGKKGSTQPTAHSKHEWDGDGVVPAGTVVHKQRLRGVRVWSDAELRGWHRGAGGTCGMFMWGWMGPGWVLCLGGLCWDGHCGW